ncbi:aminomethyl-transferring glycine dehydrogenase subunit GcvPA [Caldibacillus thermolactis]|jgi:glycine dehydrogenase subunit 1|uniref:Probable glycine dehydrogenase (decarboxylating) subunit 1 n=1 Tax=Pallidibacillus thermolactis TaxID=251051 RepID=A0ABT2WJK0_9BACI|nr:aminomethyl-transferring glycine dehydrogenase subunit GcvPA [Pallidibacillus thermolactis]MCU9595156.1 aminomethyl-transferring glycine dehydrogenase subunit GcvPA [Pallidibacillus thermolactis]MCU9600340.1 aminomethyl-transferring glycine dehydrogenase subunit GcvPA [Pallidibacillus thermolactis subsp. kokeshiiformis]
MTFRYLPMTEQDKKEMLEAIGIEAVDELFSDIPEEVRFNGRLNIKEAKSESALTKELFKLANQNVNLKTHASFLGAGVYDHYIPSIVDHVISRSEFYTAYTPYQPEISQGELQAIFEFQTMICELTGMDVANSSMYDGGTALAEAAMLACGQTRRKTILISEAVHPEYREVVKTYARGQRHQVVEIPLNNGVTSTEQLKELMSNDVAAVIIQYPNFFGRIEPLKDFAAIAHEYKSLFVVSCNPVALGILTPPGNLGADIVTGDAQPFGIPTSFGGPHCGFFAVSKKLMRKIPGRLVGQTVDEDGRRGFVLTLQAREQHIRREKATSNICSNQALNALAASVAMSSLGKKGIREMAVKNVQKANYAKKQFKEKGFDIVYDGPIFNEFVLKVDKPISQLSQHLLEKGFIAGYDLGKLDEKLHGHMLVCVTEVRTKEEIDQFVEEVGAYHAK